MVMARGADNKGEAGENSLSHCLEGSARGRKEKLSFAKAAEQTLLPPQPGSHRTHCFVVCQLQPCFVLHCPFTEVDG